MSWSLGEVEALATKAARGAGLSWGVAEEAGYAVRWLQARGLPGAAVLLDYLAWREDKDEAPDTICPLSRGTRLCDGAAELDGKLPIELPDLAFPLLLLPFATSAVKAISTKAQVTLSWDGAEFQLRTSAAAGRYFDSALIIQSVDCRLTSESSENLASLNSAIRVPQDAVVAIEGLELFAARTYAPASERSRLMGAGAGTADQD